MEGVTLPRLGGFLCHGKCQVPSRADFPFRRLRYHPCSRSGGPTRRRAAPADSAAQQILPRVRLVTESRIHRPHRGVVRCIARVKTPRSMHTGIPNGYDLQGKGDAVLPYRRYSRTTSVIMLFALPDSGSNCTAHRSRTRAHPPVPVNREELPVRPIPIRAAHPLLELIERHVMPLVARDVPSRRGIQLVQCAACLKAIAECLRILSQPPAYSPAARVWQYADPCVELVGLGRR